MTLSKELYDRLGDLVGATWTNQFVKLYAGEELMISTHYNNKGFYKETEATIAGLSDLHDALTEASAAVQSIMYMVQRGELELGKVVEVEK